MRFDEIQCVTKIIDFEKGRFCENLKLCDEVIFDEKQCMFAKIQVFAKKCGLRKSKIMRGNDIWRFCFAKIQDFAK